VNWQRHHQDSEHGHRRYDSEVSNGGCDHDNARSGGPQALAIADDVEDGLTVELQRDKGQRPQSVDVEPKVKLADREGGDAKGEVAEADDDAGDRQAVDS
jgi:hypothetical protein